MEGFRFSTGMNYHYNLGIHFYAIAQEHGERTAFKYPDGQLYNYKFINELSNQIGCYLLESGLKKGDVIAIFNEKSYIAYSLMLACLKTGIIYSNLDASSPWPRLKKILDTCLPKAIFFDKDEESIRQHCNETFPGTKRIGLFEGEIRDRIEKLDERNLSQDFHGGEAAYIMFTSGSTGFPKGAVMSHNNILNFIHWGISTFNVSHQDIFTNANPIYFDNSVFDFYVSIFSGATLVPLSHDLVKNPAQIVKAINDSGCTIWFSVPSLLVYLLTTKALSGNDFKNITRIIFGGEGFPKNKLKQLFDLFNHRITLYNVYGPTECTCICSSYTIAEGDFSNMNELAPLGNIAPNFGYDILPVDEKNLNFGELALMGPCVGMGYFNDPERTRNSFIQNPKKGFMQYLYKTGDVVERAENGYLHFRGRVDNQVKHMGYRIELEEIEAAFSTLDYVDEVGVVYEKINAELGQIKAFVSISENRQREEILSDLKSLLPPYMIPRIITVLDGLPKNSNGKIDRKQLANL